jgi:hypothetical protein
MSVTEHELEGTTLNGVGGGEWRHLVAVEATGDNLTNRGAGSRAVREQLMHHHHERSR